MVDRMKQTLRRRTRTSVLAGVVLAGVVSAGAVAQVPSPDAPVCLAKTDETGGRLGFIVRPADAALFESAGFARIACPETLDQAATTLAARCVRFRALDDPGKQMIRELYGLSAEEMCTASDAWTQTQTGG